MSSTTIYQYHYLYRITNLVEQKHYYGIRTSKGILPQDDLGKRYFSSSRDKDFRKDQRLHPENYRYKIIIVSDSRQRVAELEVKLHNKFNVGDNNKFYNRVIQSSSGFGATGKAAMCDSDGKVHYVSVTDHRIVTGELFSIHTGMTSVYDSYGNCISVPVNDSRISTGELQYINKGKITVRTENGNCISVPIGDPRLSDGELQQINKGKIYIFNKKLKKNRMINPDEELQEGWSYGFRKFNCEGLPSPIKGLRCIYNPETKQNRRIKPDTPLPSGWLYGIVDEFGNKFRIPSTKGSKWIHNLKLQKNARLAPNCPIPEGWEFGQKRSWD